MKYLLLFSIPAIVLFNACNRKPNQKKIDNWKLEIRQTEENFAKLAGEEGIYKAFITYAADDATILRNDNLVAGKKNIDSFYRNKNSKGLTWAPDFVDVADSGDLGYTYGHYTFSFTDSAGNSTESKGIFHTVWRRQADGKWRFVWD